MVTGIPRSELYGGKYAGHANAAAKNAGFDVVELRPKNPDWSRDELILALDLYLQHRPTIPGKGSREIADLSEVLNRLGSLLSLRQSATYRNRNGVYMKLMNFKSLDPAYTSQGKVGLKSGGRIDQEVWSEFAADAARCHHVAGVIREELDRALSAEPGDFGNEDDSDGDGSEAPEGRLLTRVHRARERNRAIVSLKKKQALKKNGTLSCEACGFDFAAVYGGRGNGFIECHHTRPVADMQPGAKTKLTDLVLLCANCHRMVHTTRPWLSFNELLTSLSDNGSRS